MDQSPGMLYMDASLIIFKARSIYVMTGQGPTSNGQNNSYSQPQLITADVGCDNVHRSYAIPRWYYVQVS